MSICCQLGHLCDFMLAVVAALFHLVRSHLGSVQDEVYEHFGVVSTGIKGGNKYQDLGKSYICYSGVLCIHQVYLLLQGVCRWDGKFW